MWTLKAADTNHWLFFLSFLPLPSLLRSGCWHIVSTRFIFGNCCSHGWSYLTFIPSYGWPTTQLIFFWPFYAKKWVSTQLSFSCRATDVHAVIVSDHFIPSNGCAYGWLLLTVLYRATGVNTADNFIQSNRYLHSWYRATGVHSADHSTPKNGCPHGWSFLTVFCRATSIHTADLSDRSTPSDRCPHSLPFHSKRRVSTQLTV